MKWLEIIELRSTSSQWNSMKSHVQKMIGDMDKETDSHSLLTYSRATVENNFSIHVIHHSCSVAQNGSTLGLHLASILREFGMVNHSVWMEMK